MGYCGFDSFSAILGSLVDIQWKQYQIYYYRQLLQTMSNKNNLLQTTSNFNNRNYRSVRYRVSNSFGAPTKSIGCSTRNSSRRYQLSLHKSSANHVSDTAFRLKQKINSSVAIDSNPEDAKDSYLDSWHNLLNPKQLLRKLDQRRTSSKICLPSLVDTDNSQFTSLDPLRLPIEFVEKSIIELNSQFPPLVGEYNQMRSQMKLFKERIIEGLEQTSARGTKQLARLHQALNSDRVYEHQTKMKFKRVIERLVESDAQIKKDFNPLQERVLDLQQTIFQCKPFELKKEDHIEEWDKIEYF